VQQAAQVSSPVSHQWRIAAACSLGLAGVARIDNARLRARLEATRADMARRGQGEVRTLYHGTARRNAEAISRENLRLDLLGSYTGSHGPYGAGVYLSPCAAVSLQYSQTDWHQSAQILQFDALPGRVHTLERSHGCGLQPDDDSHASACGSECVFFDARQLLPRYVLIFA
jgi:Poly(ADP-ribose) polymerase catalytic domain